MATEVPPSAGRDLFTGRFFGEFEIDIKAQIDECVPDDQTLSDLGSELVEAMRTRDTKIMGDAFDAYTEQLKSDIFDNVYQT